MLIKNENDILLIRHAVSIWKKVRTAIYEQTKVGMSLKQIDELANNIIIENDSKSAFYLYGGFPGYICISVNEIIIHGVPNDYIIKDGDSVTFDVGVNYREHFADSAFTIIYGEPTYEAQQISNVCYQSLMKAISIIKPGVTNYDIAEVIQDYVEMQGYEVIRNFTGHGCGNKLHEDPIISNYRSTFFQKETLQAGMVICIEPMIMTKSNKYIIDKNNNWSVISKNKKLTSHWEHMVLITNDGCEVLTD